MCDIYVHTYFIQERWLWLKTVQQIYNQLINATGEYHFNVHRTTSQLSSNCLAGIHDFLLPGCRARWVKVNGQVYKSPCVLVLGVEDEYPIFGQVSDVYVVIIYS